MAKINSIKDFRSNFNKTYHEILVPTLQHYERSRVRALKNSIFWTFVLILASIAYFWLIIYFEIKGKHSADLGIILFVAGCSSYWCHKKGFERTIKYKIMYDIGKCFGDMEWSQDYSIRDAEMFVSAGLFKEFTYGGIDDRFTGTYNGVPVNLFEGEWFRGKGNDSRTVFKGLLIELNMNKKFTGHTVLMEDKLFHKPPLNHLKHTVLEDVKFEKKYDVFTDDEVEARYILTPTFMERLAAIKMAFKCDVTRCAFKDGKLLIAMKTGKDLFSLGSLIKPVNDLEQFKTFSNQLVSIYQLIDHLKLTEKAVL